MPRRRELLITAAVLGVAGCGGQSGDGSSGGTAGGDGASGTDPTGTGEEGSDGERSPTDENDEDADDGPDGDPITTDRIEAGDVTLVVPGASFLDDRFESQSSYSLARSEVAIPGGTWVDGGSVTRSEPVPLNEGYLFAPTDIWDRDLPALEAELDGSGSRVSRSDFRAREFVDEDVHLYEGSDLEAALDGDVPEAEVATLLDASLALYGDQLRGAEGAFREQIENGYVFFAGADRYFPQSMARDDTLFPSETQFDPGQWVGGEDGDTKGAAFSNGELLSGPFFADRTAYVRGTGGLEAHLDDRQRGRYEDWLTLLGEGGILLPPGSWAEGTTRPGATPTPTPTPDPTADWPDDPAFTPNPEVQGPGGDAVMSMAVKIDDVDGIETFEVEFDRIELHTADGDTVPVQANVTVDFLAFDPGTVITVIFDVDIPAATYVEIDFYMDPVEVVHADDGDVTDLYEDPARMDVGSDADDLGVEVTEGDGLRLDALPDVVYSGGDHVRLEEESVGALVTGIQGVVTNPDRFTNDGE